MNEQIWPVFEFRPLAFKFSGIVRRYADGKWLEDDGEYDLAFIGNAGCPACISIDLPYQRNIITQWITGNWAVNEPKHPRGNPWHCMLREGKTKFGGDWGRDKHLNRIACESGMSKIGSEKGCANGLFVDFSPGDATILAGLVRERDTKKVFVLPDPLICMYCGPIKVNKVAAGRENFRELLDIKPLPCP